MFSDKHFTNCKSSHNLFITFFIPKPKHCSHSSDNRIGKETKCEQTREIYCWEIIRKVKRDADWGIDKE